MCGFGIVPYTEVDEHSDASESMFEQYYLWTWWLAQYHRKNSPNTVPQIPYLIPLPLANHAENFFGLQKCRVQQKLLPNVNKSMQKSMFFERGLDQLHDILKYSQINRIQNVRFV